MTSRMEVAYIEKKSNGTKIFSSSEQTAQSHSAKIIHRRTITVGTACACTLKPKLKIRSFFQKFLEE